MSRTARPVVVGLPHHITQRGNRGEDVFLTDSDRRYWLAGLAESSARHQLKVWAYCLMTNHVHLVAVPATESAMARALSALHTRYTQQANEERGWQGHLWHGRYFSCVLDDAHLWEAVRYVERNPVRAGLVGRAEHYLWSSAAAHCGLRGDPALSTDLPLLDQVDDWASWLNEDQPDAMLAMLRRRTVKGLPCGDPAFVERIAAMVGRPLVDRPRGRPRR